MLDAQRISNDRLVREGNRVARALDDAGVPRRGAVALLGHNTPEWLAAYRGATWSGRRLTPMSWRWTADEVAYVVENSEADALVIDARLAPLVADAASFVPESRRFAFGGDVAGFRPWDDIARYADHAYPDATAGVTMYYTSGTTGRPKGVVKPFVEGPPPPSGGRGGMAMFQRFGGIDGPHLVCTPLYHAGPLSYADGASLLGCDLLLLERFDPETVLRLIEEHAVSSTFMVPTQFVRLLRLPPEQRDRYDLGSLRMLMHGSAPVAPAVKQAMIEWFGPVLYEFYGGSEGGGVAIDSHDWVRHPGSVGKPRVGLTVEILDDDRRPVPAGCEGTVWFTGGERFEYKDDPDKTAEAHDGERYTLGDIGYLDGDGYLYLCDRRADVIITGGINVYPTQVEAALLTHPEVSDCCVVGVPDDEWGETVHAVVQLADDGPRSPTLVDELLAHCRDRLPRHAAPRSIAVEAGLPRTETGKLARRAIRTRYWEGRQRRI